MEKKKQQVRGLSLSTLLIVVFCSYPTYLIFTQNAIELTFIETLIPIIFSVIIGIIVFFTIYLIFRKSYFSALLTITMMYCFLNFNKLKSIVHIGPLYNNIEFIRTHVTWVAFIYAAIFAVVVFFIAWKLSKKKELLKNTVLLIFSITAGLMLFNTILAVPSIVKRLSVREVKKEELKVYQKYIKEEEKRNIYYFILDEYGSSYALNKYYDYSNDNFDRFLDNAKFSVSDSSANRTNETTANLADNFSLDYVANKKMITEQYLFLIRNGEFFNILKANNYEQYSFSTEQKYLQLKSLDGALYEKNFIGETLVHVNEVGENIFDIAYTNSMLYPIFGSFIIGNMGVSLEHGQRIQTIFDYYDTMNRSVGDEPRMIVSYICSPHTPFIFNENGDRIPKSEKANWSEKNYYLDQLKYLSNRMQNSVENIIEKDPESIIIIQSDHGFHGHGGSDPKTVTPFKMEKEDELRILNAVYFGGEKLEIEGLSGPNTLRLVLTMLGLDYPMLDDVKY